MIKKILNQKAYTLETELRDAYFDSRETARSLLRNVIVSLLLEDHDLHKEQLSLFHIKLTETKENLKKYLFRNQSSGTVNNEKDTAHQTDDRENTLELEMCKFHYHLELDTLLILLERLSHSPYSSHRYLRKPFALYSEHFNVAKKRLREVLIVQSPEASTASIETSIEQEMNKVLREHCSILKESFNSTLSAFMPDHSKKQRRQEAEKLIYLLIKQILRVAAEL